MITATLLRNLFEESFHQIRNSVNDITMEESLLTPDWGGNCLHWVLGHVVVSRCNFMMLLNVPSIWDWATCKLFIPGSVPAADTSGRIAFHHLLKDLERTQELLLAALADAPEALLKQETEEGTVADQLVTYAAHESYHAGQLEILHQWLRQ